MHHSSSVVKRRRRTFMAFIAAATIPTLVFGQSPAPAPTSSPNTAIAAKCMVVSQSREASEIGRQALRDGGNAVDAVVATCFALAVTWPEAGNIGGGGFMLVLPPPSVGPAAVIDYRETAPAKATADMFAGKNIPVHLTVGTPGTVRGLARAHERFGRLEWRDLVLPAVRLAREGITVDTALANSLNSGLANSDDAAFNELRRVFGHPDGRRWQAGDKLLQPDLAATLTTIAEHGPSAFYEGPIADDLARAVQSGGGRIEVQDLADYRAVDREPLRGKFHGHDVLTPPDPSGGPALVELLQTFDAAPIDAQNRWSPRTMHGLVESMRRTYYDRALWAGDPAYSEPSKRRFDLEYNRQQASEIDPLRATPSDSLAKEVKLVEDGPETTHLGVVDAEGWVVSNTYTLEQNFGSRLVVPGRGFLLNNEMGDFNPKPGTTTRSGLIGTPANIVEPKKRMRSSMSPSIVLREGRVVLVTGTPGGKTIITTVAQVIINHIKFGMSLRDALDAPRVHHAWFPDSLIVEASLGEQRPSLLDELRAMGHNIAPKPQRQGLAHSIAIDAEGRKTGVVDQRKPGWAAGD